MKAWWRGRSTLWQAAEQAAATHLHVRGNDGCHRRRRDERPLLPRPIRRRVEGRQEDHACGARRRRHAQVRDEVAPRAARCIVLGPEDGDASTRRVCNLASRLRVNVIEELIRVVKDGLEGEARARLAGRLRGGARARARLGRRDRARRRAALRLSQRRALCLALRLRSRLRLRGGQRRALRPGSGLAWGQAGSRRA